MIKKSKIKAGFTVLETIISILIISLVIGGVTSVVRTSIQGLSSAKEEVRAFYLAQEAIELIRNKRDSNIIRILNDGPVIKWNSGIGGFSSDHCYPGKTCYVDSYNNTILGSSPCGSAWGSCPVLRFNPSINYYGYDINWNPTNIRREIQVECPGGDCLNATEMTVIVQVTWNHGTVQKIFKTNTILTNWF